jgi:hypothetical protein
MKISVPPYTSYKIGNLTLPGEITTDEGSRSLEYYDVSKKILDLKISIIFLEIRNAFLLILQKVAPPVLGYYLWTRTSNIPILKKTFLIILPINILAKYIFDLVAPIQEATEAKIIENTSLIRLYSSLYKNNIDELRGVPQETTVPGTRFWRAPKLIAEKAVLIARQIELQDLDMAALYSKYNDFGITIDEKSENYEEALEQKADRVNDLRHSIPKDAVMFARYLMKKFLKEEGICPDVLPILLSDLNKLQNEEGYRFVQIEGSNAKIFPEAPVLVFCQNSKNVIINFKELENLLIEAHSNKKSFKEFIDDLHSEFQERLKPVI